jgi:hypothetical protein
VIVQTVQPIRACRSVWIAGIAVATIVWSICERRSERQTIA